MKTAIISTVFGIVWLLSLSAHGQGTCNGGGVGGGQPPFDGGFPIEDPNYPEVSADHFGGVNAPLPAVPVAAAPAAAATPVSTAPRARISVVGSGTEISTARVAPRAPAARLSLVTEPVTPPAAAPAVAEPAPAQVAEKPAVDEKLPESMQGLVGTWLAVARHGEGELTTVELRLDDRGWAELTVPGKDGKPSRKKSKLGFDDDELKLIGPDSTQTLGKLIEQTDRQIVLARAGGNVTFVRQ